MKAKAGKKPHVYFAALDADELAPEMIEKAGEFDSYTEACGLSAAWNQSYRYYYNQQFNFYAGENGMQKVGEDSEITAISINHYRNFIKHVLVLTTQNKISYEPMAKNSDTRSLQQTRLARNILDTYTKEKRINRYLKRAAESALVYNKGFVEVTWEPTSGKPFSVEDYVNEDGETRQRLVYEGDVKVGNRHPRSVYYDYTIEDWDNKDWVMTVDFVNKWDLSVRYGDESKYPGLAEKIINLDTKGSYTAKRRQMYPGRQGSDEIAVFKLYHKRTDAMPNGRFFMFCDREVVLYDGPIQYSRLPVFRIVPGEVLFTGEGYTDAFDIIGIQQGLNLMASTAISNLEAFGLQRVLNPRGNNLSATQISKGLHVLNYDAQAGPPQPLNMSTMPGEIFKMWEMLERTGETLSGINSVARGNPESSLKSGVALSLVQSMAVQYASGFAESWANLAEDVGTFIIELIKDFASTERMAAMAGKHNRGALKSYTGKDLDQIQRVTVDLGNPMSRTTAGRVEMASQLLQQGMIKNPAEYLNVIETGQLDPIFEGPMAELDLIRSENEMMLDGGQPPTLRTDNHQVHIQEHLSLLNNPEIRMNSPLTKLVTDHIQQHEALMAPPPQMQPQGAPPMAGPPVPQGPPPMPPGPPGPPPMSMNAPKPMMNGAM